MKKPIIPIALVIFVVVVYLIISNAEPLYNWTYQLLSGHEPASVLPPGSEQINMYCSIDNPFSCEVVSFNSTTGHVRVRLTNEGEFAKAIHYVYCSRMAYDFTLDDQPNGSVVISAQLQPKEALVATVPCIGYDPRFYVVEGKIHTFTGHFVVWYGESPVPSDRRIIVGSITVQRQ